MNTTTDAPAAPAITRRKLSHAEILKLYPWYESNKQRFAALKDAEILTEAETALKIPGLKESHLQGVRSTLGIQRPKPTPPRWRSGGAGRPGQRTGGSNRPAHQRHTKPAGPRAQTRSRRALSLPTSRAN